MVLPRTVRFKMLRQEWGVSQSQIAAAVRNNVRIKNQRRATFNNLDRATKMEEMMESAGRKMLRGLGLKKSTSKQVEELEEQMESVHRARVQHQIERMNVCPEDMATDFDDEEDALDQPPSPQLEENFDDEKDALDHPPPPQSEENFDVEEDALGQPPPQSEENASVDGSLLMI